MSVSSRQLANNTVSTLALFVCFAGFISVAICAPCGPGVVTVCPGSGVPEKQQCCGPNNTCGTGLYFCGDGCQSGWGRCNVISPHSGWYIQGQSTNIKIVSVRQNPSTGDTWIAGNFYGAIPDGVQATRGYGAYSLSVTEAGLPLIVCPPNQWNGFLLRVFGDELKQFSVFGACYHNPDLWGDTSSLTTQGPPANTTVVAMDFQLQNSAGYVDPLGTNQPVLLLRFNNGPNVAQNVTFLTRDVTALTYKISWFAFNWGGAALNYRVGWHPDFQDIGYFSSPDKGWNPIQLPAGIDALGMVVHSSGIYHWGTWTSSTVSIAGISAEGRIAGRGSEDTWVMQVQNVNPRDIDPSPTARVQFIYALGDSTSYVRGKALSILPLEASFVPIVCFDFSSSTVRVGSSIGNSMSKTYPGTLKSEIGCIRLEQSDLTFSPENSWKYAVSGESLSLIQAQWSLKYFTNVTATRHLALTFSQTPASGTGELAQGICLVHYNSSNRFAEGCAMNGPYLVPNTQGLAVAPTFGTIFHSYESAPQNNFLLVGTIKGTFSGSASQPTVLSYPRTGPSQDAFLGSFYNAESNSTHMKAGLFQVLASTSGATGPVWDIAGMDLPPVADSLDADKVTIFGTYSAGSAWKPSPDLLWSPGSNIDLPAATPGTSTAVGMWIIYSIMFTDPVITAPDPPAAAPVLAPAGPPVIAPQAAPQAAPQQPPQSAPQAAPQMAPQQPPQAAPVAAPASSPQAAPQAAPAASPVASPQAAPQMAPQSSPQAAPQASPASAPEQAPQAAPQQAPQAVPASAPMSTAPQTAPIEAPASSPTVDAPVDAPVEMSPIEAPVDATPIAPPPQDASTPVDPPITEQAPIDPASTPSTPGPTEAPGLYSPQSSSNSPENGGVSAPVETAPGNNGPNAPTLEGINIPLTPLHWGLIGGGVGLLIIIIIVVGIVAYKAGACKPKEEKNKKKTKPDATKEAPAPAPTTESTAVPPAAAPVAEAQNSVAMEPIQQQNDGEVVGENGDADDDAGEEEDEPEEEEEEGNENEDEEEKENGDDENDSLVEDEPHGEDEADEAQAESDSENFIHWDS